MFTDDFRMAMGMAVEDAKNRRHEFLTLEHLLYFVAVVTCIALDIAAHVGFPLSAAKPPAPALVERPVGTPLM